MQDHANASEGISKQTSVVLRTRTRTHTHAHAHTHTQTHAHAHAHTHTHTHTHTRTHARTHALTHTHIKCAMCIDRLGTPLILQKHAHFQNRFGEC